MPSFFVTHEQATTFVTGLFGSGAFAKSTAELNF
jgi:hypothetical protein